jgi:glutamate 5-kinase
MKSDAMKIVIKVGTNVITRHDGQLNLTNISHLADQIAQLKSQGLDVILVSSGAVGAGLGLYELAPSMSKVVRRQVLSAIGQVRLMEIYRQFFANHGLYCAQVLATKEDFSGRTHYINMKNCFSALLRAKVVPVVNENDVVAVNELMFTDNDELAGLVAAMVNAERLIILSSVDGVLTAPPGQPNSEVIPEIGPSDTHWAKAIAPSTSSFGRGGMQTKFRIAQKAARVGIATYIANGNSNNILLHIMADDFMGTRFTPAEKVSGIKKWVAYNEHTQKGAVYINEGAKAALCSTSRVSSLLPVGIIRLEGTFEKGDIIRIYDEKGQPLGIGQVQYGHETANSYIGQQGKRPLIHYDYLFIEE